MGLPKKTYWGKRCRVLEIILPILLVTWIIFLFTEHYLGSDVLIFLIKASLSTELHSLQGGLHHSVIFLKWNATLHILSQSVEWSFVLCITFESCIYCVLRSRGFFHAKMHIFPIHVPIIKFLKWRFIIWRTPVYVCTSSAYCLVGHLMQLKRKNKRRK